MKKRFQRAFVKAAPIAAMMAVMLGVLVMTRWLQVRDDLTGGIVAVVALSLVIFLTYFSLGLAGYRVRGDGFVASPRMLAWLVVAVVTIGVIGALFIFVLF